MSATPVFDQLSDPLVYELSTLSESGLDDYWAGYFAGVQSNLGASPSTTEVWQDIGGFYLFLESTPNDWTDFSNSITALLPNLGPPNTLRFLWISNPQDPPSLWEMTTAHAKASGSGSGITWTLQRSTTFSVGSFTFLLSGLSELSYIQDVDGGGIGFPGGGSFTGPAGGYVFDSVNMLFTGSGLGAFDGLLPIPAPADAAANDLWTSLNVGLQYASAPPIPVDDDIEPTVETGVDEFDPSLAYVASTDILYMPVFGRQSMALDLGILFDPLNPLVATRTALSLFPAGTTQSLIFDSYLRTTRGYQTQLTPIAAHDELPDAQFVLGRCPLRNEAVQGEYWYHFCPDGGFTITVQVPPAALGEERGAVIESNQLLLGLSGLEYVTLSNSDDDTIIFQGGNPAYIPAVDPGIDAPNVSDALTDLATTAHLAVVSSGGEGEPVYYAQPREAPIFSGKDKRTDGVLDFNAMPAFVLSSVTGNIPNVYPVGMYAGLDSAATVLASQMENSSLAPYRHYVIGDAYGINALNGSDALMAAPQRRERDDTDPLGVTPQGLIAELTDDYTDFDGLILGNMPNTNYPTVKFTAVEGMLKQALQSNQLFFVASNIDVLMSATSVAYEVTLRDKPYVLLLGVPESVFDTVYDNYGGTEYETEDAFINAISGDAGTYLDSFVEVCGILKVEMDGWTFQLSPRSWRTNSTSPTLMIAKFCNRSLLEMANDTSSWAWPEVGMSSQVGATLLPTQTVLLDILNAAGADDASESYQIFYDTVVTDPTWNGFLFLNAPVDIAELPDDLSFLVAGIDLKLFYAHHIGFSQTPFSVEGGVPVMEQTAAFGLIDYVDTLDLYSEETIPFGFKTMQLNVRFANAALADFAAQVELMMNDLLGAPLTKSEPARGNNLIINGSYQNVGGTPTYAFALTGQNVFNTADTVLTNIEVLSVQLVTGGDTDTDAGVVFTTFILMGNLRFIYIEDFDLYSFGPDEDGTDGYLRYTGLAIDMQFSLATPTVQTFTVHEGATGFDLSNSIARESSLVNKFPLSVSSLIASPNLSEEEEGTGQTPEDMGYTSISAPLDQVPMTPSWYGLQFSLDMGTFGALTGSVSFKISILAAWQKGAGQTDPPMYLGLSLPNIPAIGGSFPLQGVLKLGFRSFQFETYISDGTLGYKLRLKRFALSVLVWSFPPGNSDIVLFGDPNDPKGSLGWYAAYDGGDDSSSTSSNSSPQPTSAGKSTNVNTVDRRLQSGRRTPPVS